MIESIVFDNVNLKLFVENPPEGPVSNVWNSSVTFKKGKSYLVEATSGRGKSSFCSFLCGLRDDYVGDIALFDDKGNRLPGGYSDMLSRRQKILAMMFQEHRLFPELSSVDNVMLKNQITGFATESEIRSMLVRLGLGEHLDRPCGKMSFGQQQRVAFVRALCQPFDFILLDEPVSHLDGGNARIMAEMLRERQEKDGVGIIVTSIGYRLPYEYDEILYL